MDFHLAGYLLHYGCSSALFGKGSIQRSLLCLLTFSVLSVDLCRAGSLPQLTLSCVFAGLLCARAVLWGHRFRLVMPAANQPHLVTLRSSLSPVLRSALRTALLSSLLALSVCALFVGRPAMSAVIGGAVASASVAAVLQLSGTMIRAVYTAPAAMYLSEQPQPGALIAAALVGKDPMARVRVFPLVYAAASIHCSFLVV